MELPFGSQAKDQKEIKPIQNGEIGLKSETLLVTRLLDQSMLHFLLKLAFLAMILLTLPCIGSILRELTLDSPYELSSFDFGSDLIDVEFLNVLLRDLANEGLVKKGDKALIVTSSIGSPMGDARYLSANGVDLVLESSLAEESLFPNETIDFAFYFGIDDTKNVDRIVKVGGIIVTQLDQFNAPQKYPSYKVVYLRRYDSTIVAMKKTSSLVEHYHIEPPMNRRLFQLESEAKRIALEGLEDVLLEPPRKFLPQSRKLLRNFNYLPDLLHDSLEDYARRVFVDVGTQETDDAMTWFKENYPTRNQEFELYSTEETNPSNWLIKNVREDDFVVMKAEADVVEEMIMKKSIKLVDELFLGCKNHWQNPKRKKLKRAYWECLALYGRLRDEGIAVHQWWG